MRHKWFWGKVTAEDDPRWSRIHIRCEVCKEERDVWIGMTHNPPSLAYGCPGRIRSWLKQALGR